ncbi:MAG: ATPase, partial [Gemmatimonadota bacterium]|nr:ATPase [Gemmatimonadota bacterium]
MALLADFGTSWTKTLDTSSGIKSVRKTTEVASLKADLATGHNTRKRTVRTVNELIALGDGAMQMTGDEDYTVLDIGSRDVKYVRFEKNRVAEMNWSAKCGALTGFTLELIMSYFSVNPEEVKPGGRAAGITCGVLGMEQLFEAVASGKSIGSAVAEFTRGLAMNAWFFIGKPERFYLSGGMCDNPL